MKVHQSNNNNLYLPTCHLNHIIIMQLGEGQICRTSQQQLLPLAVYSCSCWLILNHHCMQTINVQVMLYMQVTMNHTLRQDNRHNYTYIVCFYRHKASRNNSHHLQKNTVQRTALTPTAVSIAYTHHYSCDPSKEKVKQHIEYHTDCR